MVVGSYSSAIAPPTTRTLPLGSRDAVRTVCEYVIGAAAANVPWTAGGVTTLKSIVACGATPKVASPTWLALIAHSPSEVPVTVVPVTLHTVGVNELKATARPELVETATVAVPPTVSAGALPKVMLCAYLTLWVTSGAGLTTAFPAWSAATVQAPMATPVTVPPETEQKFGVSELNVIGSPELADATKLDVPPTVTFGVGPNVMV